MSWRIGLARLVLLLVAPWLAYAALHPEFVTYYYVPHNLLRSLGVPYSAVLWFEVHLGDMLHMFIAFILVLLLPTARIMGNSPPYLQRRWTLIFVATVAPLVELYQLTTGRGFSGIDLVAHYIGMFLAAMLWKWSATRIEKSISETS